jgi:hypothetical protein
MRPSKVLNLDSYRSEGRNCKKNSYQYIHPEECFSTDSTLERSHPMVSHVPTQRAPMLHEHSMVSRQHCGATATCLVWFAAFFTMEPVGLVLPFVLLESRLALMKQTGLFFIFSITVMG